MLFQKIIHKLRKRFNQDSDSQNYNDRADGYGCGESESRDAKEEYMKDPYFEKPRKVDLGDGYRDTLNKPYTKDEYGTRNLYGPVDQYVFRSHHLVTRITRPSKEERPK